MRALPALCVSVAATLTLVLWRGIAHGTDLGLTIYQLEVSGSLSSGIVLTVKHRSGQPFFIQEVRVTQSYRWPEPPTPPPWILRPPGAGRWYWRAEGESARAAVHTIQYGHPPAGLENKEGPHPLEPNKVYYAEVFARGPSGWPLPLELSGNGAYKFELDEHGVVKKGW